jgi:hypothetical protein
MDDDADSSVKMEQLFFGTWIGIAALAELLIDHGTIDRADLLSLLAAFQEEATPWRAAALAGLRLYIDRYSAIRMQFDPIDRSAEGEQS